MELDVRNSRGTFVLPFDVPECFSMGVGWGEVTEGERT